MSQLKVNTIRHTGASSDAITLASTGGIKIANYPHRNLIHNGSMQVAQRGTSSTTSGYGTVDRFQYVWGGTNEDPTQAQHALTSSDTGPWEKGFRYSYHITNGNQTGGADTGDFIWFRTYLEAQDIANSGWDYTSASSYVTLSFWVKSSVAQDFKGYLRTFDGTAQTYAFSTGSLTADTWTKITKTIPGNSNIQIDSNNEAGFQVNLFAFMGSTYTDNSVTENAWATYASGTRMKDNTSTWYTTNDATLEVTGVQLEVGDTATDFEHRSYADELVKCHRYYWKWVAGASYNCLGVGWAPNTTRFDTVIMFPQTMRASPSFYTGGSFRASTPTASPSLTPSAERTGNHTAYLRSSSISGLTAGEGGEYGANNDGSAYVAFDAEL